MKKKILIVSNMYPSKKYPHYGVFVQNTYKTLNEHYDVSLSIMTKHNNKFIKLFAYIKFYLVTLIKGIFNNYDYIYVHFISHSSLIPIIIKKIKKNVKLVLNAHGNDVIAETKIDLKNIKRSKKYLKYADKVVVPSNYFKEELINAYNVKKNIITIFPSGGVNTNLFRNIDIKEAKKNINLDTSKNYIGYVSRIENGKGYELFIELAEYITKKGYDYNYLIVGDGTEYPKLLELITKSNIKDKFILKKMVDQKELVNVYNALDLFIFPTMRKSESLGLVGLEAMSCKTFSIIVDKYGPSEYIKDKINGLCFKQGDIKSLIDKFNEFKSLDNEQINKIKNNARETAIKYDTKNTKEIIINLFKE